MYHFLEKKRAPRIRPVSPVVKYITTALLRNPTYREVIQGECLPQLTPGLEKKILVSGPTKHLINFGQELQKNGVKVFKTINASGDIQLIVDAKKMDQDINDCIQAGLPAVQLSRFVLEKSDQLVAIQKKGTPAKEFIKTQTVSNFSRFVQPAGGSRLTVVVDIKVFEAFLNMAALEGFQVYGTQGRLYATRAAQSRDGLSSLISPNPARGEIEIASIPLTIKEKTIWESLNSALPGYDWHVQQGSSPFNYSMMGINHEHRPGIIPDPGPPPPLTHENIEHLLEVMEPYGVVITLDRTVLPRNPDDYKPQENLTGESKK